MSRGKRKTKSQKNTPSARGQRKQLARARLRQARQENLVNHLSNWGRMKFTQGRLDVKQALAHRFAV